MNNSLANERNTNLDRRIFIASSIFFFAALINPRDFPVPNVPLIYPAFFFFTMLIGPHRILQGFRRTKFLCVILSSYWFYLNLLFLIKGRSVGLGSLAYLVEPLLVLGAVGAVTIRHGGTKAALWALVSMVTLSTACGIWIYFIGEPVASLRSALHSSIGGSLVQGEYLRDVDLREDVANAFGINAGLSYFVFLFSYQLAVTMLIVLTTLLSTRFLLSKKNLPLWTFFVILFVGVITNAERATILSVSTGLLCFFLIKGKRILNTKFAITFILCVVTVISLMSYTSKMYERFSLQGRVTRAEEIYVRGFIIPTAAVSSIFFEPLGSGGMSNHYKKVAYRVGWAGLGGATSSHNHFTNIIMYTGIVGVFITLSLFLGLWRKIKYIRLSAMDNNTIILGVVCITAIVHSLTHNAGFFMLEPATLIVFGLLWGSTAGMVHPRYSNLFKKWIR
jgi:O-Antigen ligase